MKTSYSIIFSITKTHLLTRIKQSAIAALGVTFGIGTFIIMMSFMTGLNGLLDGLVLNRTPHIQLYNEILPSQKKPVQLADNFTGDFNIIHSIKPKNNLIRIHNAIPIMNKLKADSRILGITPQVSAKSSYLAGSIELNGMVSGINVKEEMRLFNFDNYVVKGSALDLIRNNKGIILGAGAAENILKSRR